MNHKNSPVILFAYVILSLAAFSGCTSKRVKVNKTESNAALDYVHEKERLEKSSIISPGFTLSIHHSADESISGDFKVNFQGMVKLPYSVSMKVAGISTEALAERITKAYSSYFKVRNNVRVDIVGRDYLIEVRGLVQKPGVYSVKLDTSIEEVIAKSGGLPSSSSDKEVGGKPEYIRIVKPAAMNADGKTSVHWVRLTDYFLKYDVRNEVLWRGGEELFFQLTGDPEAMKLKSQTITIMGEVNKPGEYPISSGSDLHDYIAKAGGPTSSAELSTVRVIHKGEEAAETFDLTDADVSVDLAPGDVILVKSTQSKPGFMERVGPLLISVGSFLVSVALLIISL